MKCPKCDEPIVLDTDGSEVVVTCDSCGWEKEITETVLEGKLNEVIASLDAGEFMYDDESLAYSTD